MQRRSRIRVFSQLLKALFVQIKGAFCHQNRTGINLSAVAKQKRSFVRKIFHAGGWQVAKRTARMLPFGGTLIVVGLVGHDIKKKGVFRGIVNSGLDAIPVIGLAKNAIELFTGDFIADKDKRNKNEK
jgi:hypothetical protein